MYLSEALYKVERVYYPKDYKTSGGNIALCEVSNKTFYQKVLIIKIIPFFR